MASATGLETLDVGPFAGICAEADGAALGEQRDHVPLDLEVLKRLVVRQADLVRGIEDDAETYSALGGDDGRHVAIRPR